MEFNSKFEGIPCNMVEAREEDTKWYDIRQDYDFGELTEKECEKFYKFDWQRGKAFKDVFTGRYRGSGFSGGQKSDLHFHITKIEGTDKVHVTMFRSFLLWKEGCCNSLMI